MFNLFAISDMPTVQVPNFAAIIRAQPSVTGLPTGAVVASSLGQSLGAIAADALTKRSEKDSIMRFANVMEAEDPQQAALYRAMAESIPLFDPGVLQGGGTAGSGSRGGMTSSIMSDMMDSLNRQRELKNALQLQAVRTNDAIRVDQARHALELAEIAARNKGRMTIEEQLQEGREKIQALKDAAAGEKNDIERQKLIVDAVAEQRALDALEEQKRKAEATEQLRLTEVGVRAAGLALKYSKDAQINRPSTKEQIDRRISTSPKLSAKRDEIMKSLADPNLDAQERQAKQAELQNLRYEAYDEIVGELPVGDGMPADPSLIPASKSQIDSLLKGIVP